MNETTKTGVFVGAALVAVVLALLTRPVDYIPETRIESTGKFFPNFTDPLQAASLEIIRYDQDTGEIKPFKVAKQAGLWTIPSKLDYPADAERQLAEAAADIIDVEKLGVASETPGDHALYGVVDPQDADAGATGVGTRVSIADGEGRSLAQLIIGKEVKDKPELRYARLPRQDVVYEAKISTGKLSTKFEDWIEKDLLKLSGFDIRRIVLDNYSIDEVNGRIAEGDLLDLKYDDKEAKWNLEGLTETEELVSAKLNDLKNALDDLKIADVRRKPPGLSQDLKKAEGLTIDAQAYLSLQEKGFFIVQDQLRSNEGDVIVQTKDGVEYMLRFGEIAVDTEQSGNSETTSADAQADAADGQGDAATPSQSSNRYLFVTARFNPDLITKPDLQPVPEVPAAPELTPTGDEAADTAAETEAKAKQKEAETARQKVEQENKRKQDEYDKKIKEGEKRVAELNARFADWYYVISDDVFKKIHLTRADVVGPKTEKPTEGEGTAAPPGSVDEFNQLQEGLPGAPAGTPEEGAAEPSEASPEAEAAPQSPAEESPGESPAESPAEPPAEAAPPEEAETPAAEPPVESSEAGEETAAPETAAPETAVPETAVPETAANEDEGEAAAPEDAGAPPEQSPN